MDRSSSVGSLALDGEVVQQEEWDVHAAPDTGNLGLTSQSGGNRFLVEEWP